MCSTRGRKLNQSSRSLSDTVATGEGNWSTQLQSTSYNLVMELLGMNKTWIDIFYLNTDWEDETVQIELSSSRIHTTFNPTVAHLVEREVIES